MNRMNSLILLMNRMNSLIFSPPEQTTYTPQSLDTIVYIPRHIPTPLQSTGWQKITQKWNKIKQVFTQEQEEQQNSLQAKLNQYVLSKFSERIPCLWRVFQGGSDSTVLYFHDGGVDLGGCIEQVDALKNRLRVNVLAIEYPGYGLYYGMLSVAQVMQDAQQVYTYLVQYLGISPSSLLVYGQYLGTGPALHLASTQPLAAVLLHSPFRDMNSLLNQPEGVSNYLVKDPFDNLAKMKKNINSTLLIYDRFDERLCYCHSQELMAVCKGVVYMAQHPETGIHQDHLDPLLVYQEIKRFLSMVGVNIRNGQHLGVMLPRGLSQTT